VADVALIMPWLGLFLSLSLSSLPPAIDAMPEPPRPDVTPLLPAPRWQEGDALPAFAVARDHHAALLADPLHAKAFWVEELAGNASSRRVVFLIPQFHRNPIVPIEWTSLGAAIVEVQSNIDGLVTRLAKAHGLKCIGTEGSWRKRIDLPHDLRQPAQWLADLERARRRARGPLLQEAKQDADHLDVVYAKLRDALALRVALYDGVGTALERLGEDRRAERFGIEDEALNRAALVLLAKLQRIDESLAVLNPAAQSDIQTAMGRMWLDEIDAYEAEVLAPLRDSLTALDERRVKLRGVGADAAAEDVGRFVSLAKHVWAAVIKPDQVAGYTAYYRRVGKKSDAGPPPERVLSLADKKERERLKSLRAPLQKEYDALSIDERERRAAQKVVRKLGPAGTCAVVMGAVHKDALKERLIEQGKGDLAVIVVAPYSFDGVE
jgi:hypothetical protein